MENTILSIVIAIVFVYFYIFFGEINLLENSEVISIKQI